MLDMCAEDGLQTESLYWGEKGLAHQAVAPHLVQFEFGTQIAEYFWSHWGGARGILLQSKERLPGLRKHLRKFLLVEDPQGARFRFRFYDPRVLRTFLPVSTSEEYKPFFGPVEAFFCEGRMGRSLHRFEISGRGLSHAEQAVGRYRRQHSAASKKETAALTVMVTCESTGEPIAHASIKAEGPETLYATSKRGGAAHFESLSPGEYRVLVIDQEHRMGERELQVEPGSNHLDVECA